MKNQYFGDRNDMFKYDLSLTLVEQLPMVSRFTFIPMLTPDDGRTDGSLTDYRKLGVHRPELHKFLIDCVREPSRRRVSSLRDYMGSHARHVKYVTHWDDAFVTAGNRTEWLRAVPPSALEDAVILLDPDNGFEVASMTSASSPKYLRYGELATLYSAIDDRSIILAYQHWARVKRSLEFDRIAGRIAELMPDAAVACVSSGSIGFFAIAKDAPLMEQARAAMHSFADARGFVVYPTAHAAIF